MEENALKALQTKNPNAPPTKVYLQVGTFSQKNNALTLQESLKQQGFSASIKETTGERGPIFRVRIGPILDKDKAQTMKGKLSQINVNSLAVAED
jgi:DedD protein